MARQHYQHVDDVPYDIRYEQGVHPVSQLPYVNASRHLHTEKEHETRDEEIYRHALPSEKTVYEMVYLQQYRHVFHRDLRPAQRESPGVEHVDYQHHQGQRKPQQIKALRTQVISFHPYLRASPVPSGA